MSTESPQSSAEDSKEIQSDQTTPIRRRLDDIRRSITHHFTILTGESGQLQEVDGYIVVGLYDDGQPGELFVKIAKQGSTISGLMNTVGILTSMALQYGVPLEAMASKLEYMRFEPSGRTSNEDIRQAQSVVDYIFRWLRQEFTDAES